MITINGHEISDWMGQFTPTQQSRLFTLTASIEGCLRSASHPYTREQIVKAALHALEVSNWKSKKAEGYWYGAWYSGQSQKMLGIS